MKLLIGLSIVFLVSCHNARTEEKGKNNMPVINSKIDSFANHKADSFDIFLNKFVLKVLPISVDQKLLDNFSYENVDLDTLLVDRFVEKNKLIIGDLSIYSSTKYYPLYKFKVGSMWGIIIMYSGGSGAIDDKYHLIVYDSSGLVKSNLLVGKQTGSCESLETQTFSISSDYLVSSKINYYSGNCETGKMKLTKTQALNYQIDKSGNIKQLP